MMIRSAVLMSCLACAFSAAAATPAATPSGAAAGSPTAAPAGAPSGAAIAPPLDTAELDRRLQAAQWPADIVRLAEPCLARHGRNACQSPAALLWKQASATARVLAKGDVPLSRSAFMVTDLPEERLPDLRLAALGDVKAAVRLARTYQNGRADSLPANPQRYLGWLQYASQLGDDGAAYELALHYRSSGQPALAAVYEARAIALGYKPPTALDNMRK